MADALTGRLKALGLTVTEDDAGEQIGGSSGNLYGFLPGTLDLPSLLLCAHMDTVAPWQGKRAVREADGTIHSAGIRCWAPMTWRRWPSFWRCSPP